MLIFEWDSRKNAANKRKHHIGFEDAILVFKDLYRIERYDKENSLFEDRYITIGKAGKVLFVVYVERGDHIRIISARYATNAEQEEYYANYNFY